MLVHARHLLSANAERVRPSCEYQYQYYSTRTCVNKQQLYQSTQQQYEYRAPSNTRTCARSRWISSPFAKFAFIPRLFAIACSALYFKAPKDSSVPSKFCVSFMFVRILSALLSYNLWATRTSHLALRYFCTTAVVCCTAILLYDQKQKKHLTEKKRSTGGRRDVFLRMSPGHFNHTTPPTSTSAHTDTSDSPYSSSGRAVESQEKTTKL